MAGDGDPRILRIELPTESTANYRQLYVGNDEDDGTYAVVLVVSIFIDGFIEQALGHAVSGYPNAIRVDAKDRMQLEIHHTTLEEVRDRLDLLKDWLKSAVAQADKARRATDAEDDRLSTLVRTINASLATDPT